jgi:hypothetical protein
MITAAARRFLMERLSPIITAAGWTSTSTAGVTIPRLFHGVAPAGTTYPFVVFQMLSPGNDQHTQNGREIWSDPLYLVKAVTQGTGTDAIESTRRGDRRGATQHARLRGRARGWLAAGGSAGTNCLRLRRKDLYQRRCGVSPATSGGITQ